MSALDRLAQTIAARRGADPDTSWTAKLLAKGPEKCAEKFGEEAVEAIIEAVRGDRDRLTAEAADVLYHLLVMLAARGVALTDVLDELERREGRSGVAEKAARAPEMRIAPGATDLDALETLYGDAFPDEDLTALLAALLALPDGFVSLGAWREGRLIGHCGLTACDLSGDAMPVALLGPLAVSAPHQGQGIGRQLIRTATAWLAEAGFARVFVLGDPSLYGRFGFAAERAVAPPYPLPPEWYGAWQSLGLPGASGDTPSGALKVPKPWQRDALWGL